jgi:hypothetical protein
MKSINIAPTWVWVTKMALSLIEAGDQKKAEAGFVEELERLGPDVKLLIKDFRSKKTREAARGFLLDKAKRCDEALKNK